jgi:hypothetical protein
VSNERKGKEKVYKGARIEDVAIPDGIGWID